MTQLKYIILLFLIISTSCGREDSDKTVVISEESEETITYEDTHFIGIVEDEDGKALKEAKVSLNASHVLSSTQGISLFKYVKTNAGGSILKSSKKGYFDQYDFIITDAKKIGHARTVMRQKTILESWSNDVDKSISIDNVLSLFVPKHSFLNANGQAYGGMVYFSVDKGPFFNGTMPFISNTLKIGVLQEASYFNISAEDENGNELQLAHVITLSSTSQGFSVGMIHEKKERWVELPFSNPSANRTYKLSFCGPLAIGKLVEKSMVKTKITNTVGEGISFAKVRTTNEVGDVDICYPDQEGSVRFYTIENSNVTLEVFDHCNSLIRSKTIVANANEVIIPDMVIGDENLKTVSSVIESCGENLDENDLVNLLFKTSYGNEVYFQTNNVNNIVMSNCADLNRVEYYRNQEKKYSINLVGSASNNVTLNAAPLCIPKVSGTITVNDKTVLLEMSQFSIYRELGETNNLSLSDFNGFLISIPNCVSKGKYKADAVFFNNPNLTDCVDQQCNDLTIYVDVLGSAGELVKIRIEGQIGGDIIKGEFTNLLRN